MKKCKMWHIISDVRVIVMLALVITLHGLVTINPRPRLTPIEITVHTDTVSKGPMLPEYSSVTTTGFGTVSCVGMKDSVINATVDNTTAWHEVGNKRDLFQAKAVMDDTPIVKLVGSSGAIYKLAPVGITELVEIPVEAAKEEIASRKAAESINANDTAQESTLAIEGSVTYKWGSNLRELCALSSAQVEAGLQGRLKGKGEFLRQMQRKYNVNLAFAVAVSGIETSYGTAGYGKSNSINNLYNIRPLNSADYVNYNSHADPLEASIEHFFRLIDRDYLTPGGRWYNGTTVAAVHVMYAEAPTWATRVEELMSTFYTRANRVAPANPI